MKRKLRNISGWAAGDSHWTVVPLSLSQWHRECMQNIEPARIHLHLVSLFPGLLIKWDWIITLSCFHCILSRIDWKPTECCCSRHTVSPHCLLWHLVGFFGLLWLWNWINSSQCANNHTGKICKCTSDPFSNEMLCCLQHVGTRSRHTVTTQQDPSQGFYWHPIASSYIKNTKVKHINWSECRRSRPYSENNAHI